MVYIAYFTGLILQICDYAQKRRIWRKNCKYALDENFHCHFCSRRKAAKFCHPGSEWNWICQSLLARSHAVLSMCSIDSHFALSPDTVVYGYSWYLFDNEYALLLWPLWCSSTILICKIFLWEMNKRFRTLEIYNLDCKDDACSGSGTVSGWCWN